ncbi:MAG: PPE domain-containing protein [Mycolicibacterium sp.]|uniref:PPE domain-containing protein n=1 Tax=Mycolicibacterium sp. TaxID=2320850 RepID=UPI003D11CFD9
MTDMPEALPPEINAGLVHGGAGPEPFEQAALSFAAAALQDQTNASVLTSILSSAQASWQGTASLAGAGAMEPLIAWFEEMAANGTASAQQVQAAATAVAQAIATCPHPMVVGQNRVTWASLCASNFLGILTPAINVKDAEYLELWIQSAFARATSDVETELATTSLVPLTPPPMAANVAMMGAGLSNAATVAAKAPASAAAGFAQFAGNELALDGLLVQSAAGDVAGAATQPGPRAAMYSATDQDHRPVDDTDVRKPDASQLQQGTQQMSQMGSQMAGQMGGMLSSALQPLSQVGSQAMQPLSQMTQAPMQFSSMLQPLLSSSSLGQGGGLGSLTSTSQFAAGSGEMSAAITRPMSGGGGGGGGLRLPGASLLSNLSNGTSSAAANKEATKATTVATSAAAAGAGSPGMFGAPLHGAHNRSESGSSTGNKYAGATQLGPAVAEATP